MPRVKGAQVPSQIASLLDAIKPAVAKANQAGDRLENTCKANVLLQAEKLKSSPVITQLIEIAQTESCRWLLRFGHWNRHDVELVMLTLKLADS